MENISFSAPGRRHGHRHSPRTLVLSLLLLAVLPLARADTDSDDVDLARERARGWAPPTPEDTALFRSLGHRLEALHLNSLALRRLHAAELDSELDDHALLIRRPGRGSITRPLDAAKNDSEAYALEPGLGVRRLPRFVDNSALPCFPPIFDQGNLESCTAVVTTYYQLTHTVGLMRGWDQSRGAGNEHRFSPAWTYNLTNNGSNSGVSLMRAYAALSAHGAVSLVDFPYRGSPAPASNFRRWPEDPQLWRRALEFRADRFGLVDSREPVRYLREIKRLLLNGHVLTASTAIDGWNRRFVEAPPGSALPARHVGESVCTVVDPEARANHAVTIVGYDDDLWVDLDGDGRVGPGEQGALKVANSWGRADWNQGFRWIHYTAVARYGPVRREDGAWRGAFWLDRVYWLIPYRYYQPARILELDLAPALRSDIGVQAGAAPSRDSSNDAYRERLQIPNLAFARSGGPFAFSGTSRPGPSPLRLQLDFTPALLAHEPAAPSYFLQIWHPLGQEGLRGVSLLDPLTGAQEPVSLGAPDPEGLRWVSGRLSAPPASEGPVIEQLPLSLAVSPGQPESVDFTVRPRGGSGSRPVRVVAFSTRASTLSDQELRLSDLGEGRRRLEIFPRPNARGSALVLVHATDGWTRSTATLRVNLQDETNTAPTLSVGQVRAEGEFQVVPLVLSDFESPPEKLTVYFDTPQVESILDFSLTGKGSRRELRLRVKPGEKVDLRISAFDGELIGEAAVTVSAGASSSAASAALEPEAPESGAPTLVAARPRLNF